MSEQEQIKELQEKVKNLQLQLRAQQKLASLGMLVAGIAHEIQNPLNFVINFSKMSDKLLSDLTDIVEDNEDKLSEDDREEIDDIVADLKENMSKIVEHGERAISIIRGILLISRGKEGELIPTDVCHTEVGGQAVLGRTIRAPNSLAHRTTWLRSDFTANGPSASSAVFCSSRVVRRAN